MIQPRLSQGFPLLPGRIASSRLELPGCLTPIACEAGQERLRLILSWGALPFGGPAGGDLLFAGAYCPFG